MQQKIKNWLRATVRKSLIALAVATLAIIGWEQIDDSVEAKVESLTTVKYERAATSTSPVELRSDEERRIDDIKKSDEAQAALEAYAKGVYAEELRKKAEDIAEEARAAQSSF